MPDIYKEDGPTAKAVKASLSVHIAGEDRLVPALVILARAIDEINARLNRVGEGARRLQQEAQKGYNQ
jgi:hypothetical protein